MALQLFQDYQTFFDHESVTVKLSLDGVPVTGMDYTTVAVAACFDGDITKQDAVPEEGSVVEMGGGWYLIHLDMLGLTLPTGPSPRGFWLEFSGVTPTDFDPLNVRVTQIAFPITLPTPMCRCYGRILGIAGVPMTEGWVEAELAGATVYYGGTLITPYKVRVNLDASGYWFMDIYPNSLLTPDDTTYTFRFKLPGFSYELTGVTVAAVASQEITIPTA